MGHAGLLWHRVSAAGNLLLLLRHVALVGHGPLLLLVHVACIWHAAALLHAGVLCGEGSVCRFFGRLDDGLAFDTVHAVARGLGRVETCLWNWVVSEVPIDQGSRMGGLCT